jgi:hypothetical protein
LGGGTVSARGSNDADEALERLVTDETITRKQIERDDGTTIHYQLA